MPFLGYSVYRYQNGFTYFCLFKMMSLKPHINTALAYFLIAAALGLVLRFFSVLEIPITYKFFVHTHSHIAVLGWVYVALTSLIYKVYVQQEEQDKRYRIIFWCTQITLVGMLFSFPFQGYALFSIIFSTSFLFASYAFFWLFTSHTKPEVKQSHSYKLMKAALWYMVLSSIGPWALGGIMSVLGPESIWYRMAIYFYLHFQYNGWMILALVALFFYVLEQKNVVLEEKSFRRFFWLLNLGIILSFFLSALFADPPVFLNLIGGLGAVLQLLAFVFLGKEYFSLKAGEKLFLTAMQTFLLQLVVLTIAVKMIVQVLSALPFFVAIVTVYLDFVIGYLHWTFLGVLTLGIFFFFDYFKFIALTKYMVWFYLIGFIATEALLFHRAIAGWQGLPLIREYPKILAVASLIIVISLGVIFISSIFSSKENQKGKVE